MANNAVWVLETRISAWHVCMIGNSATWSTSVTDKWLFLIKLENTKEYYRGWPVDDDDILL